MQVDAEIELPLSVSFGDCELNALLPSEYFIEERGTRKKALFLRSPASNGEKVDETISRFLGGLRPLSEKLLALDATLRVGIFYDVKETAIFPFRLGPKCVEAIALCGLTLDATIYLCNEADED